MEDLREFIAEHNDDLQALFNIAMEAQSSADVGERAWAAINGRIVELLAADPSAIKGLVVPEEDSHYRLRCPKCGSPIKGRKFKSHYSSVHLEERKRSKAKRRRKKKRSNEPRVFQGGAPGLGKRR